MEADSSDGKHIAVFRAIQGRNTQAKESGISKNRNFYPGEVAEALAPLLSKRPKMYLNHKKIEPTGRPMEDLAGVINEAWGKGGASYVKTDVLTENPSTGWIWEVMKKYPDQVGVSICAAVRGRRATIDKTAVFAVEGWRFLHSLDFVGDPSAGGTLQHTESREAQEGTQTEEPREETMELTAVQEAFKKNLSGEMEKSKRRHALDAIGWTVTSLIRQAAFDRETDEDGRRKNVKTLVKDFATEIGKIDPVGLYKEYLERSAYMYEGATPEEEPILAETAVDLICFQDGEGEVVEAVLEEASGEDAFAEFILFEAKFSDKSWSSVDKSKLPPSAFLIVGDPKKKSTWHLPYKDESGAVNKGALRAIAGVLGGARGGHKFSIPANVKAKIERLLKAAGIGKSAKKESTTHSTQEAVTVDLEELKKLTWEQLVVACPAVAAKQAEHETALAEAVQAKETAEAEAKTATEGAKTATEAKTAAEKQLDEYRLKESVQEQTAMVDRLLGESKVIDPKDPNHVSEAFRKELLGRAKDGEDAVKESITDREGLITSIMEKKSGQVVGNGQRKQPTVPVAENTNGSEQPVPYQGVTVVESDSKEDLAKNLKSHR